MKHKVTIGRDNAFYRVEGDMFEEGEKIDFFVPFLTDVSTRVTSDDVAIQNEKNGPNDYHYSIIVPDHDVTISISTVSDMMKRPSGKEHGANMGAMSGFMRMKNLMNGQLPSSMEKSVQGKKKFCPACGARLNTESQKFCQDCGSRIE